MVKDKIPAILRLKWDEIEQGSNSEVQHVLIDTKEFFVFAYAGNLLFTPEEIQKAHERFIRYPKVEKTWPIWELSEGDIQGIAEQFGLCLQGLNLDDIAYRFNKAFHSGCESWDETLRDVIKEAIAELNAHQ